MPSHDNIAVHPTLYNPAMLNLESLAREAFGELTVAEVRLLQAAPTGEFAVCGSIMNDTDPSNNPANADSWGKDREIRMKLIRWVCLKSSATELVDPKGLQIYAAKLIGVLDLSEMRVPFRIAFVRCSATEDILLRATEIPLLAFDGSWVQAVKADGAEIKGGVSLRNGFRAGQQVRFHRARIGSDLDCSGGSFVNPHRVGKDGSGSALGADGAIFGGGVILRGGFHAEGEVRLSRARIGGDLDCSVSTFQNRRTKETAGSGVALNADGVNVVGSVFLRGARVEGEVRLPRAKVGDDIDCGGASITNPFLWGPTGSGAALTVEGSIVGGNLILNSSFKAIGFVTLRGAKISGQLNCTQATFDNIPPSEALVAMPALDASLTDIGSGAFLGYQFVANGEVRLQAARVGAILDCNGGTINNPAYGIGNASGRALTADGLKVSGRLAMGAGFHAEGEVFLIASQIGGDLDCGGGVFNNPPIAVLPDSGHALSAHKILVSGNVFLRSGFSSSGEVSFSGAAIDGNLEGTGGRFEGELNLETATVKGVLMLGGIVEPKTMRLTLTNASVGALADEKASWPGRGSLLLDGFVYRRFSGLAPKDFKNRLDWLALQNPFLPQPYQQVAGVLREEGEDAGAVQVLYEMERRVRARENRLWRTFLVDPILRWTIGFGYYPARAFWWLSGIVLLGFALYVAGYSMGSITPTDKDAYATFKGRGPLPAHYGEFHALIYSIENSFPFVRLGQVDRWQPDPHPSSFVRRVSISPFTFFVSLAGLLRWYQWSQILCGWILGTLFIAGVTGIVRKN